MQNFLKEKNIWPLLMILLIIILFSNTVKWLFEFWSADSWNLYGLVFSGFAIYLIYWEYKKNHFDLSFKNEYLVLISIFSLVNFFARYFVRIELLSALILLILLVILLYVSSLDKRSFALKCIGILLLLSLPLQFYINSAFGYFLRKMYALSIFAVQQPFINPSLIISDTTIFNNNLFINIDSGCSGVYSMYMLSGFLIFFSSFHNLRFSTIFKNLICVNLLYFGLNWFHLFVMVLLYTSYGITNIRESHELIGIVVTGFALLTSILLTIFNSNKAEKDVIVQASKYEKLKLFSVILISISFVMFIASNLLQNKQNSIRVMEILLSPECSEFKSYELNQTLLTKLSDLGVTKVTSFIDKNNRIVIVGKTKGTGILANISKLVQDKEVKAKYVRTQPIKDNGFIREIVLDDGNYVYFYLKQGNEIILEFTPWNFLTKRGDSKFVLVGEGEKFNGNEEEVFGYEKCIE